MTDLTLPGGWQWTTSPHDLRHGIAVAKVWWVQGHPFIRCQVGTELDRAGNRRTFGWLSYAEVRGLTRPGRKVEWRWQFIMDIPELPPDPLAAAMMVEVDYGEIERAVLKGLGKDSLSTPLHVAMQRVKGEQ